jgi:hypothetical protein
VSGTVATVNVVASDHNASELLSDEVHLVRRLRATEHPERGRTVILDRFTQLGRSEIERLVPPCRP